MIKDELDALFVRWKRAFFINGEICDMDNMPLFTADGIMLKRDLTTNEVMAAEAIDKSWMKSRKIVFVLKEQNQHDDPAKRWSEDIRYWFVTMKKGYRLDQFFRRIGLLLYGLSWVSKIWAIYASEIEGMAKDKIREAYLTLPFAFVEAKKSPGGRYTKDDIGLHLSKDRKGNVTYGDFLNEELDILDARIIVCCGEDHHNYIINNYFPTDYVWAYASDTLHYDAVSGKIIIKAYHPSYQGIKYDFEYYEKVMEPVRKLLSVFPDALNVP